MKYVKLDYILAWGGSYKTYLGLQLGEFKYRLYIRW